MPDPRAFPYRGEGGTEPTRRTRPLASPVIDSARIAGVIPVCGEGAAATRDRDTGSEDVPIDPVSRTRRTRGESRESGITLHDSWEERDSIGIHAGEDRGEAL